MNIKCGKKNNNKKKLNLIKYSGLKWVANDPLWANMNFLPIEEGVVEVFAEALQNPVVVPDGGSLILTGRKVTLQLRDAETNTVILLCEKGNVNSIPRKSF